MSDVICPGCKHVFQPLTLEYPYTCKCGYSFRKERLRRYAAQDRMSRMWMWVAAFASVPAIAMLIVCYYLLGQLSQEIKALPVPEPVVVKEEVRVPADRAYFQLPAGVKVSSARCVLTTDLAEFHLPEKDCRRFLLGK